MAESPARRKAADKYRREKCDILTILTPKGTREVYKRAAEELGMSLAQLMRASVEEYIRNHGVRE